MAAILVVATIVLFIVVDLLVQRLRRRRAKEASAIQPSAPTTVDLLVPNLQPERFVLPAGVFFHPGHTWANLLFSGQVKVGIDDFLQRMIGRMDAITLPPVGVEVKQGQPFVAVHQGARTAMLVSPVDGVVCAVNGELSKAPGLLKRDPYTQGWLAALRPTNLNANLRQLAVGEGALAWLKGELHRLQEFLHVALTQRQDALVGTTAADGGVLADGLLEHMNDDTWTKFQSSFLGA